MRAWKPLTIATVVFHLTHLDSAILLSLLTYSSTAVLDSAVVKEHGGTDAEDAPSADTAQSYLDTASAGSGMYVMTSYIFRTRSCFWKRIPLTGEKPLMLQVHY